MRRKLFGALDTHLRHEFLLLCWTRFSGRQRLLENRRRLRSDRLPLVNLLSEKIRLISKKNFSPFDLAQIKHQGRNFLYCRTRRVGEALQKVTEASSLIEDAVKDLLFVRLEGKTRDLGLPLEEILKLWTSSISGDLLPPVANRAGVFVALFYFSPGYLEALSMVPSTVSNRASKTEAKSLPFPTDLTLNHHPSFRVPTDTEDITLSH